MEPRSTKGKLHSSVSCLSLLIHIQRTFSCRDPEPAKPPALPHLPPLLLPPPPLHLPSTPFPGSVLCTAQGEARGPKKECRLSHTPTSFWCNLSLILTGTAGPLCAPELFVSRQTMKALPNASTQLSTEAKNGQMNPWLQSRPAPSTTFSLLTRL